MPTPPGKIEAPSSEQVREAALARLRQGTNPFSFYTATAGTEHDCLHYDVPELLDSQRSDLRGIVGLYRQQNQPSRTYPVIGDSGTGKTHLLTTFQAELHRDAEEKGSESLLIVADHFAVGLNPVDFFLWQIINHLLAQKGPGARMLRVLSDRLTAYVLAEALRQLPPHLQAHLIPPRSLWERIQMWFRSATTIQVRLDAVRELIARCDVPVPSDLGVACEQVGLLPECAHRVIQNHVERTEPKDVTGYLRREFYIRLARLALLGEQEPIEEFLTEGYREGPTHVTEAGKLTQRLLTVFLELFNTLHIPVILVFDQLEDFLRAHTPDRELTLQRAFIQDVSTLINNVSGLCLLVFAEESLWTGTILQGSDVYAQGRLGQEFTLPGRPSQKAIEMPTRLSESSLNKLIARRIRGALGNFNPTGLPDIFPFSEDHLQKLPRERTIRMCLQRLSAWFNEIVFTSETTDGDDGKKTSPDAVETLTTQLRAHWDRAMAGAKSLIEEEGSLRPALIPEVQAALDRWLTYLMDHEITGSGPWATVELIQDANKGVFGYLNVVRFDNPHTPGVGLAAWFGERRWRANNLMQRLEFFNNVPCPIRTLVLFRHDGEAAVASGVTKDCYDQAIQKGRDVRVQGFDPKQMESLLAFPRWLQSIRPDVEAAGEIGRQTLRHFVSKLSTELLQWIDSWR